MVLPLLRLDFSKIEGEFSATDFSIGVQFEQSMLEDHLKSAKDNIGNENVVPQRLSIMPVELAKDMSQNLQAVVPHFVVNAKKNTEKIRIHLIHKRSSASQQKRAARPSCSI